MICVNYLEKIWVSYFIIPDSAILDKLTNERAPASWKALQNTEDAKVKGQTAGISSFISCAINPDGSHFVLS